MGASRGLNEREADKLLRDLFQGAGQFSAPEGLDARILQRIAVLPRTAILPDKPLLPKWTWLFALPIVVGIGLLPSGHAPTSWSDRIPSFDWSTILASPWLIMGLASFTVLLGLDAWLNRKRTSLRMP
jgi:hypothetical protein